MNNEISLLVEDIPQKDVDIFIKNTKSTLEAKEVVKKVTIDYSWIDEIEKAIPSIDNIIRNPRRFIVSEEDVVRIEKTKKISLESIKDLAVHTNYIQEVDEDGFVKPIKLLNIFKEETIDLYENRFIYTLITNMNRFVEEQLTYMEKSTENTESKSLSYEGNTNYEDHNIKVNLTLVSQKNEEEVVSEEVLKDRTKKIEHIKEVIGDFMASKFMKMMKGATAVRSPIRKTNVILKDYNFVAALQLWEFLERCEVNSMVKEVNKENDLTTNHMNRNLDLTYYLNYCILNDIVTKKGNVRDIESLDLLGTIFEHTKDYSIDEKAFKKEVESKIAEAISYKAEQKASAKKAFKMFVDNHELRYNKAISLFK